MSTVEEGIDQLYKGPLADFVAGRTALARALEAADASRVKAQQKPRAGPWAVNQVYWHARPLWDRLAKSGEKLRAQQIAALEGRRADLRGATQAHHAAVAAAVTRALQLASAHGVKPGADELARTFEALSVAREWPEPRGRLTRPLQPAGFEALAGVALKPIVASPPALSPTQAAPRPPAAREQEPARRSARDNQAAERRKRAAEERRKQAARQKAEAAVARAEAAEARARRAWERTRDDLERAQRQARQSE